MTHRTAGRLIWLLLTSPIVLIAALAFYAWTAAKLHAQLGAR